MAEPLVTVETIDLVLREAQVCNAQLNCIHHLLNHDPDREDEESPRNMETNTAMIFRDMVSYLYSVLDHIFYFLYCHFQNNGMASFTNAAFNIKQPIAHNLKFSRERTRDRECNKRRNEWVQDRCEDIFGAQYDQKIDLKDLRGFQKNLLSIQAITEVDRAGNVVHKGNNDGVRLMSACFNYTQHQSNPLEECIDLSFKELPSVQNLDAWNDAMVFNLLHFFRNFTTHRTLIECQKMYGVLNLKTMEFRSTEQASSTGRGEFLDPKVWIDIKEGSWIKVPELSHLKHSRREDPITFYKLPMVCVSSKFLSFVEAQRDNLRTIIGVRRGGKVKGDKISFGWDDNKPRVKINGLFKEWYNARSSIA